MAAAEHCQSVNLCICVEVLHDDKWDVKYSRVIINNSFVGSRENQKRAEIIAMSNSTFLEMLPFTMPRDRREALSMP